MIQKKYRIRQEAAGYAAFKSHPTGRRLYYWFVDESDCNLPDHYGVADSISLATIVSFNSFTFGTHLSNVKIYEEEYIYKSEDDETPIVQYKLLDSSAASFAKECKLDKDQFVRWWDSTDWEFENQNRAYYLTDLNGYLDYQPVWAEDPESALSFSDTDLTDEPYLKNLGEIEEIPNAKEMAEIVG